MKVTLLGFPGTERLKLGIFLSYGKNKMIEITRNELALKLSNLLPNPIALMFLCQLPKITAITYRNNFLETSLTYNLLVENDLCSIVITDLDEDIIKTFNQYFF